METLRDLCIIEAEVARQSRRCPAQIVMEAWAAYCEPNKKGNVVPLQKRTAL
jgi:hypothetical protein